LAEECGTRAGGLAERASVIEITRAITAWRDEPRVDREIKSTGGFVDEATAQREPHLTGSIESAPGERAGVAQSEAANRRRMRARHATAARDRERPAAAWKAAAGPREQRCRGCAAAAEAAAAQGHRGKIDAAVDQGHAAGDRKCACGSKSAGNRRSAASDLELSGTADRRTRRKRMPATDHRECRACGDFKCAGMRDRTSQRTANLQSTGLDFDRAGIGERNTLTLPEERRTVARYLAERAGVVEIACAVTTRRDEPGIDREIEGAGGFVDKAAAQYEPHLTRSIESTPSKRARVAQSETAYRRRMRARHTADGGNRERTAAAGKPAARPGQQRRRRCCRATDAAAAQHHAAERRRRIE